jgi:hypothetical protein
MIFSLDLDNANFIGENGRTIENTATLTIGRTFDEGFTYAYSQLEFVITPTRNTIDFFLYSHLKEYDVGIASVCCTLRQAIRTTPIRQSDLPPGSLDGVRITFQHLPELLISIGLVVKIREKMNPTAPAMLLLCDPQVGSGPP